MHYLQGTLNSTKRREETHPTAPTPKDKVFRPSGYHMETKQQKSSQKNSVAERSELKNERLAQKRSHTVQADRQSDKSMNKDLQYEKSKVHQKSKKVNQAGNILDDYFGTTQNSEMEQFKKEEKKIRVQSLTERLYNHAETKKKSLEASIKAK